MTSPSSPASSTCPTRYPPRRLRRTRTASGRRSPRSQRLCPLPDLDSKYRPGLEARLESDEELHGICIASQQKSLFKGGAAALGVTDRRLLIQALDRGGNPVGEPLSLAPEQIAEAKAGPAGGEWFNVEAVVLDHAAV